MKTKPFYLLPYRMLAKRWRTPALLLIPAGILLWWSVSNDPQGQLNPLLAPLGLLVTAIGILLTFYVMLLNRAQVRCYDNRFVIQTPIYPIAISYQRVELVRTTELRTLFPPDNEKPARWRLYKNLWGLTAIVVNLKTYPMSRSWLKLWFHPFLLHPKEMALVLPIEDWMGLSRQLEGKRAAWRESRRR